MKVLLITSRFPWPPHSGDRLRALIWLEALRDAADVTLIAPEGSVPEEFAGLRHVELHSGPAAGIRATLKIAGRRLPVHTLMAGRYDWKRARAEAGDLRNYDALIVLLPRCEPWVRHWTGPARRIFDAVDALSLGMKERARAAFWPARPIWHLETLLARRLESRTVGHYDRIVVVNQSESGCFPDGAVTIRNGVELEPAATDGLRRFDFAFWGHLGYFANVDALELLLGTIWPRIRELRPTATLLIAGASAAASLRALDGKDGITIVSPMDDRSALLRQVRVALLPLRRGTGHSNKILEAAEASCAIAGSGLAFRGVGELTPGQIVDNDPINLAQRATALLDGDWQPAGETARTAVEQHHDRRQIRRRMLECVAGSLP
ncbi:MAG TPA: glycosyltransferase [Thermoanaerobaculia bacterium]